jgi:3-phosphoshikimate 1-carboxyvinyltransferase
MRMAMAFAPLAMLCGEIIIDDPLVVKKSYPQFWDHLQILGFDVEEIE